MLRSSVQTINRYRTATEHLLRFLESRPVRHASQFTTGHAEEFVRYLRRVEVSPNGHANTDKRRLMDKGLRYVLECCRALFNFAATCRHLSPYSQNPFSSLRIDRIPVENARPVVLLTDEQEEAFFERCDDWQFPLFLTLSSIGLRPGELCHLLLPDDLDLERLTLHVRNKPTLGWRVKTGQERTVPLLPELAEVLRLHLDRRKNGPVFRRRQFTGDEPAWSSGNFAGLETEMRKRIDEAGASSDRVAVSKLAKGLWRDLGAVREDGVRVEFMRLTESIGVAEQTAPKVQRHRFATSLQEGRVDPLVRNLLMGHGPAGQRPAGHGLGMTAVYTHTSEKTVREQLAEALQPRPALRVARTRLDDSPDKPI